MTDKATSFSNRNLTRSTIQKGSLRVPFGADLYVFCGKEGLHPNLVKLFKYVKMNSPRHLPMPVYSKSSWWESKWLKRALQKGDLQAMNSYSPAAYILALRNFMKHLPSAPLLQRRSFVKLADDIRALPASHWTLAILQSRKALRTLRPVEYSLVRQLVDMLRNLCFDNDSLNQSRLQEMTTLFGPVLIRKRIDEPVTSASKPCAEAIALIRFMVLHGPAIFMDDSDSLGASGGASTTASMVNQASASCSIMDSGEATASESDTPNIIELPELEEHADTSTVTDTMGASLVKSTAKTSISSGPLIDEQKSKSKSVITPKIEDTVSFPATSTLTEKGLSSATLVLGDTSGTVIGIDEGTAREQSVMSWME